MNTENHVKELELISEKMLSEMLARGYVPAQVEKLQEIECSKESVLIFQLKRQLPHDVRKNLIANFTTWLRAQSMYGLFLPPDIDLVAILNKPAIENVLIESEEKPEPIEGLERVEE